MGLAREIKNHKEPPVYAFLPRGIPSPSSRGAYIIGPSKYLDPDGGNITSGEVNQVGKQTLARSGTTNLTEDERFIVAYLKGNKHVDDWINGVAKIHAEKSANKLVTQTTDVAEEVRENIQRDVGDRIGNADPTEIGNISEVDADIIGIANLEDPLNGVIRLAQAEQYSAVWGALEQVKRDLNDSLRRSNFIDNGINRGRFGKHATLIIFHNMLSKYRIYLDYMKDSDAFIDRYGGDERLYRTIESWGNPRNLVEYGKTEGLIDIGNSIEFRGIERDRRYRHHPLIGGHIVERLGLGHSMLVKGHHSPAGGGNYLPEFFTSEGRNGVTFYPEAIDRNDYQLEEVLSAMVLFAHDVMLGPLETYTELPAVARRDERARALLRTYQNSARGWEPEKGKLTFHIMNYLYGKFQSPEGMNIEAPVMEEMIALSHTPPMGVPLIVTQSSEFHSKDYTYPHNGSIAKVAKNGTLDVYDVKGDVVDNLDIRREPIRKAYTLTPLPLR